MKITEKTIVDIKLDEEDEEVFRKAHSLMKQMCNACSTCSECPCEDESANCIKNDMENILDTLQIDYQ